MQASPSPALIEQSRRNAKRLAKQADIQLNQAQDQIAQSHGFGNWSQFAKAGGTQAKAFKGGKGFFTELAGKGFGFTQAH